MMLDPKPISEALPLAGPIVGADFPTTKGQSIQVEVTARMFSYTEDRVRFGIKSAEDGELGGAVLPVLPQIGVGYNF